MWPSSRRPWCQPRTHFHRLSHEGFSAHRPIYLTLTQLTQLRLPDRQRRSAKPGRRFRQSQPDQYTLSNSLSSGAQNTSRTHPALAVVIDAWPTLPEAVRAGIAAMVKAAAAAERE